MKFARRYFVAAAFVLGSALAMPALAQTAGKDYTPINPPQPTDEPAKIEVTEFFSYGCPHCSDFNPLLAAWAAKQSADVVIKRVPVSFNSYFAMIAPLFYTLEATGDLARLDAVAFRTIHGEGNRLADAQSRSAWAVKNGIDGKKFDDTYRSFGVASKVRRADQMTQAYKIQGVPALAIDGKYVVGGRDFNEALAIADKLVAKVRAEKFGKK
ncbi:MAG: thiol:disulfide interchange protein DsbA/DsbL [Proteobacteria bacterium]|nr:thiol:disulfide interchange protein DsbA/DsbL [Pseudomonadota bacterium]